MCHAAVHLNSAHEFAYGRERYDILARINLEAAKRCKDKSAFAKAAAFLCYGLVLLDKEGQKTMWSKNFNLALELTETLAKMDLIIGDYDMCKKLNREALRRCHSIDMKINSLVTDFEVRVACNEAEETIAAARRALMQLGVPIPQKVTALTLMLKLRKVRKLVAGKADEDILNLPMMQHRPTSTAIKLLVKVCAQCIMVEKETLAVYVALLATELTMRGGLSPYSANSFAVYGIVEVALETSLAE
ncbi:PFAM Protein kinase domain [Fragilaria crotonensis]|nr:PFAM Protein kinase domain [Fragilaria crotonensis]